MADMRLANKGGFLLAAKVVRGAYIHLERERAAEMGYPSPIHDTLEDTHHNYNRYTALRTTTVGWLHIQTGSASVCVMFVVRTGSTVKSAVMLMLL